MRGKQSFIVKLLLIILMLTGMALTAMGAINYISAKQIILASLQNNANSQVRIHATQLETWLNTRLSEVVVMANTDLVRSGTTDQILAYFEREKARMNGTYASISVGDTKGNLIIDKNLVIQIGSEPTFPDVMAGKPIVSNPFPAKENGSLIISFEAPVRDMNNKVKGLVSGASPIGEVFRQATDFKVGQSDQVYVFQSDGLIIHHPDKNKILKENVLKGSAGSSGTLAAEMLKTKQGMKEFTKDGHDYMVFYHQVPGTSWMMALEVPLAEFTSPLNSLLIKVVISGAVTLVVIALFVYLSLLRPVRRIRDIASVAERIAGGDLRAEQLPVDSEDEIGHLSHAVNGMLENLRRLIDQVNQTARQVASSSQELAAGVAHAGGTLNQITIATQEVAVGVEQEVEGITKTAQTMEHMTNGVHQIASSSSVVAEAVHRTAVEAEKGNRTIQQAVQQMNTIGTSVEEAASVVRLLGERSQEIGGIIGVITSIAEQTNLLALNAAIEAARAGEQGKGFAVVADEVRKLAEQSKQSADQIAQVIQEIQGETQRAVGSMNKGTEEVSTGVQAVDEAGLIFQNIMDSVESISTQISQISVSSEEMAISAENILKSGQDMLVISRQSAGNSRDVAGYAQEQISSIDQIAAASASLSRMALELEESMQQFKTDKSS
ncbi:methyl-accepting chemotaxis sensory transducer with Cache sensor [Aneurinibacillus soli]|uniref:Methyl-accepting chemotaxis protein McpB n=1 Tax=Aneurinibacillus soli TaxID=1500254 RepID=A0A0U5B7W3_9BACL|nr:methyl-accepting chemotaxis protein [Aneurinibacillus soli]PYE58479.1 methyl-accepting chemotaxis sensory transducer with Cache sensor [Aneurinibacillus soli]BAU29455.1 Methyl-accepting chemotaxis protein McpB [Aneurinibacillus soli]